jgi:hypothetical protein
MNNDTQIYGSAKDFNLVAQDLDFEVVRTQGFCTRRTDSTTNKEIDQKETLTILVHRGWGLILVTTTYTRPNSGELPSINKASLHYAWKPSAQWIADGEQTEFEMVGSGSWESLTRPDWREIPGFDYDPNDMYRLGWNDVRSGLRHQIARFVQHGTLLAQWPARTEIPPNLFFCPCAVNPYLPTPERIRRIKDLRQEIFDTVPQWVRDITGITNVRSHETTTA